MQQLLPSSFVDFSEALRMLANSQGDITEIVSKWADITNADTPSMVTITLSDGTGPYEVPNLAKIRSDIVAGLSLDEPTVNALHFKGYRMHKTISGNVQYGNTWHDSYSDSFDSFEGYTAFYGNLRNDFRTICFPSSGSLSVTLLDIPRIVLLGAETRVGVPILDDVTIEIAPPPMSMVTNGSLVAEKQYCTMVTFVNRNFGSQAQGYNTETGYPVKLSLILGDNVEFVYDIEPRKCLTLILFAPAGGTIVNVHEVK